MISIFRDHAERIHPPRALHCEFPLGRPLGVPNDAAFQRRVLDSALGLLAAKEGPVLEDFPNVIEDSASEPLSCTVPPRNDASLAPAIDEARGLRKAYNRALEQNGHTNVGRLADADGIEGLLESFVKVADGVNLKEAGFPLDDIMEASKDVMSYYEEAASALVDHVPAARAAESWFFEKTEGAALILAAKAKLKEAKWPGWMLLTAMHQR
ncbi:MAG: hypothetical protein QGG73_06605 [Candidatus Hydrogenedentes bacterium]|jgi:hypothetical protein|nr:hypothetical protein [Candidatus Hydrogenedentota bacterium]